MHGPDKLIYPYSIINIFNTNKLSHFPTIVITLLTSVMPLRSSVTLYIVYMVLHARL